MLGNFTYCNPTKLYFGKDAMRGLDEELPKYGKSVLLVYGGGSIKKNGIYDSVVQMLKKHGKTVAEDGGVMPNPTTDKLAEGCERARRAEPDLILAVGGGSVCDYAKALSVSVYCGDDPWEKFYRRWEEPDGRIIPVGCVLTMVGTGSEMNGGSVITNPAQNMKIGHVFGEEVFPKFSVLDPEYTFSVPRYQMVAGFFDIMSHIAVKAPTDYEARSNIMWTATWALNTFVAMGKDTDWEVHMLGHAVSAHTDATHGMTLAAVSPAYYRLILPYGLAKFRRYAVNVWGVDPAGKTDEQVALEGLAAMEAWMRSLGLVMRLSELGVTRDMLEGIADSTLINETGYKVLTRVDVLAILERSL